MNKQASYLIGILGAGQSGQAAAHFLAKMQQTVVLTDDDSKRLDSLSGLPKNIAVETIHNLSTTSAKRWLISPGIAPTHRFVHDILGANQGFSDLDLWQEYRSNTPTIAVTGTNGKSTVTRLIQHLLNKSGYKTIAGANLGTPIADLLEQKADVAVLEVSSFQLFYSQVFCPQKALITNLAADHFDWHLDFQHYHDAKKKMFDRLGQTGTAILPDSSQFKTWGQGAGNRLFVGNGDDVTVRLGSKTITLNMPNKQQYVLEVPTFWQAPYQVENIGMAIAAVLNLISASELERNFAKMVDDFTLGEHRGEEVVNIAGIGFIDNSKATNLHAMVATTQGYCTNSVHLLVGGKNKNLDWQSVLGQLKPAVKAAYAYGETAGKIAQAWQASLPTQIFETLEQATHAAFAAAKSGDFIILAPGTSSFDQFKSYKERGEIFSAIAQELRKQEKNKQ